MQMSSQSRFRKKSYCLLSEQKIKQAGVVLCFLAAKQPHMQSESQEQMCSYVCTCAILNVADQIKYLTQSQYTNTGTTVAPGAWQGSG